MNCRDYSHCLRPVSNAKLPTKWGDFRALGFEHTNHGKIENAVALVMGEVVDEAPLVRIHSECLTGDVFGSQRCDCGQQLEYAMRMIAQEGRGILIYERQEGRGIGLMAKLQAYELQDGGLDTVDANMRLGLGVDMRDYLLPVKILAYLGVRSVRLLTNNPGKVEALTQAGIEVAERLRCEVEPSRHTIAYLTAKKKRLGHLLTKV